MLTEAGRLEYLDITIALTSAEGLACLDSDYVNTGVEGLEWVVMLLLIEYQKQQQDGGMPILLLLPDIIIRTVA